MNLMRGEVHEVHSGALTAHSSVLGHRHVRHLGLFLQAPPPPRGGACVRHDARQRVRPSNSLRSGRQRQPT
ncbi:MAG: hypothetical protein ABI873_05870, partial [Marmoricola sp.]